MTAHVPRSHPRFASELPATATVAGEAVAGTLRNLSMGGALFVWHTPPSHHVVVGMHVELALLVPDPEPTGIATSVIVRWTTAQGAGIQFLGLRAREAFALGKYLAGRP